jgi:hypothetical protein
MKWSILYIICDKGKVILGRLPDHRPVSPHAHLLFWGILVDFGTLLSIEYVEVYSNVLFFMMNHANQCSNECLFFILVQSLKDLTWYPFIDSVMSVLLWSNLTNVNSTPHCIRNAFVISSSYMVLKSSKARVYIIF